MALSSTERLRDQLTRVGHRGGGVRDFSLAAARILARAVPFDGFCLVTMDPATMLPTGEVVENGLPPAATTRMAAIEITGEDFNSFAGLRRSERPVATLSDATSGDLARSLRHRELRAPRGLGDELRAALIIDRAMWGGLTLLRGSDWRPFSPAEVERVRAVARHLSEGLRRALMIGPSLVDDESRSGSVGLLVLGPANRVSRADATAVALLRQLPNAGEALPPVITAVAARARQIAAGQGAADTIARARVRADSGAWLLVRASLLADDEPAVTVVTIEPAGPHELAPLMADAYGLTDRERAVTELVAQGLSTAAIARRLHLSPWTVQDHLKAAFEKVGTASRGEIVARLFFARRTPTLTE
jgi:DNA-binding CsgD family transcriptional regulator